MLYSSLPENKNFPVNIPYNITPKDHESVFIVDFSYYITSGDKYYNVPSFP